MILKRRIEKLERILNFRTNYKSKLKFNIPLDPQKFYQDVGFLTHPKTNQLVTRLAPYQYQIWNDGFRFKNRLTIKSQKCGISTSSLFEDFQKALTTCKGKEILIIAQDLHHAKDHLYTLRKIIKGSKKYSSFLIDKSNGVLFKDEVTKITTMFIHNTDNPYKPTKIIGLGAKEGGVWSWKEVAHIHMSDVAATNQIDDSGLFNAAFSRLANTDGTIHIETPPRGQRGKIWEIFQQSELNHDSDMKKSKFHIRNVYASQAVDAGLITQEFLEQQKEKMGPQYGQYYECDFLNPYNTWYDESLFKYSDEIQLGTI